MLNGMMVIRLYSQNKSSAVAEMGDRGHYRHGPKRGGAAVPLSWGGAGSPSNTMWPGSRSTSVPCLLWPNGLMDEDPSSHLATIDMG